jgi:hypothetical protein
MRRIQLLLLSLLVPLGACKDSPTSPGQIVTLYKEGELHALNVNAKSACDAPDYRTGRVVAVTDRAVVIADTANPRGTGTFSDPDYRRFAADFDRDIWPTITRAFGEPHDIDGNGRVVLFFTRAVNEMTPRGQSWYVGGFFFSRDLFPKKETPEFRACGGSNQGEILYLLVPDPQGVVNGNARTLQRELANSVTVIAHELQHLINASRRLFVIRAGGSSWSEETWLNEGLSHVAEELMLYGTSSLGPRQNIDGPRLAATAADGAAFNRYQRQNVNRFGMYLEDPEGNTLIGQDSLTTRGAAWSFLRYAADRRGGDENTVWKDLVTTRNTGLSNLRAVLGGEPMDWMHDWLVSLLVDDLVPGTEQRFRQASWNHRSVFASLRTQGGLQTYPYYPLRTHALTNHLPQTVEIMGGSAAFIRFAGAAGARSELRFGGSTAACTADGTVTLGVGEVHFVQTDGTATLCVQAPPTGGEYALVPFSTSTGPGLRVFTVAGSGLGTLPPEATSLQRHAGAAHLHASPAGDEVTAGRHTWEAELREREIRELGPLVRGAGPSASRSTTLQSLSSSSSLAFRVALVRIR